MQRKSRAFIHGALSMIEEFSRNVVFANDWESPLVKRYPLGEQFVTYATSVALNRVYNEF
jgi:hypothetical protein